MGLSYYSSRLITKNKIAFFWSCSSFCLCPKMMKDQEGVTLHPSEKAAKSRSAFARDFVFLVLCLAGMVCVTLYYFPPRLSDPPPTHYATLQDVVINDFEPYPADGSGPKVSLYNNRDYEISVEEYHLTITSDQTAPSFTSLQFTIPPYAMVTTTLPDPLPPSIKSNGGQLLFQDPSRERTLDSLSFTSLVTDPALFLRERKEKGNFNLGIGEGQVYYRDPPGGLWSETLGTQFPSSKIGKDHSRPEIATFSGNFEIHILDVGQGDSQLIVFPSGYSILIDVNEDHWQHNQGAEMVAKRIQTILGHKHVNVGVISHLHLDHLGYAGKGGFWALMEQFEVTFDKVLDRDSGIWVDQNGDGECDSKSEIEWRNAGTFSGTATNWLCYATNPANDKIYPVREVAKLCNEKQIDPPDELGWVRVVTVDGRGAQTVEGGDIIGDHTAEALPPSENDYSLGLLIKYGDFTYITCGDLDGEYATATYGYTYNNIEEVVAARVGEVDVYHLNHHGSGHSSSEFWLSVTQPTVSIGSCGTANTYGHPDQATIDRVFQQKSELYITSDCDLSHNYYTTYRANSDIVLTSVNGSSYSITTAVHNKTYVTKPARPIPPCP